MTIQGIDAVMLYARDPEALSKWYARHLGIRTTRNPDDRRYYGDVPDERPLIRQVTAILERVAKGPVPAATRRRAAALAARLRGTAGARSVHFGIYPLAPNGGGERPAVMVNYRVRSLNAVLRRLRAAGVEILDVERESYGTFAHLRDAEHNLLELWTDDVARPRRRPGSPARNSSRK
jgi:catechol 2,3-dioxygenase-like lactoylglutathione lyase family enzyme